MTESKLIANMLRREPSAKWPDPTPAMLEDPIFNKIWNAIKGWDIAVPEAYGGYCGATGNHARAIYDAIDCKSLDDYPLAIRLKMLAKAADAMENGYLAKTLRETIDVLERK